MCVCVYKVSYFKHSKNKRKKGRGGHTNLGVLEKYGNRIRKGKREREKGIG